VPNYEIGTGDYLIITTNSGLDRKVFDKTTGAPDLSAKEQIQVEFRSNSLEHGKLGAPFASVAPAHPSRFQRQLPPRLRLSLWLRLRLRLSLWLRRAPSG